jgi:hypothetical protein
VNQTTHRFLLRPLTGLALAAALVGVPMAAAASAAPAFTQHVTPLENRYCDSESGYDCLSYGYAPDSQADYTGDGDYHHRRY